MDRDPVGGRWSDGALWPLSLGTGGLRRGPASSSPVSGTHGPLPREGWVETPLGVGRVQEWGVKETVPPPTRHRDPAAATLIPPAPLHCSPASYLLT